MPYNWESGPSTFYSVRPLRVPDKHMKSHVPDLLGGQPVISRLLRRMSTWIASLKFCRHGKPQAQLLATAIKPRLPCPKRGDFDLFTFRSLLSMVMAGWAADGQAQIMQSVMKVTHTCICCIRNDLPYTGLGNMTRLFYLPPQNPAQKHLDETSPTCQEGSGTRTPFLLQDGYATLHLQLSRQLISVRYTESRGSWWMGGCSRTYPYESCTARTLLPAQKQEVRTPEPPPLYTGPITANPLRIESMVLIPNRNHTKHVRGRGTACHGVRVDVSSRSRHCSSNGYVLWCCPQQRMGAVCIGQGRERVSCTLIVTGGQNIVASA